MHILSFMAQCGTRVANGQACEILDFETIEFRIIHHGQQYAAAIFEAYRQTRCQEGNCRRVQAVVLA
ncbi:hypothetical protein D3C76_1520530 [compost metagenome]